MKKRFIYYWILLMAAGLLSACFQSRKKELNSRVTLWRNDKIPYGNYFAYHSLSHLFPDAEIVINKKSPDRYKNFNISDINSPVEDSKYDDKKSCYIIISREVMPDNNELEAILNQVWRGNHVFISAIDIGSNLLDSLKLQSYFNPAYFFSDSLTVSIYNPVSQDSLSFTYPGMNWSNYFSDMDSSVTTILGMDKRGRANFVRISYESGGAIYLHLAPLAFSNFFLLHKNNKAYYDNALSYIPQNMEVIKWDDYFRNRRARNFSRLQVILNNQSLRWAFWLVLALFALIYLFETKRRQRMIPFQTAPKNATLDFVKTIGRLYYQRRDNSNLAAKMSAHFFDHVRNRYNISTSRMDEEFENRLIYKSGYDNEALKELIYKARTMADHPSVSDDELLEFNRQLENFYKH